MSINGPDKRSEHLTCHEQGYITATEYKIIEELVKEGATNPEIGRVFTIEPSSVRFHITNLLRFSDTKNRTALALWWIRKGRMEYLNRNGS